jgi:hypothetical protein
VKKPNTLRWLGFCRFLSAHSIKITNNNINKMSSPPTPQLSLVPPNPKNSKQTYSPTTPDYPPPDMVNPPPTPQRTVNPPPTPQRTVNPPPTPPRTWLQTAYKNRAEGDELIPGNYYYICYGSTGYPNYKPELFAIGRCEEINVNRINSKEEYGYMNDMALAKFTNLKVLKCRKTSFDLLTQYSPKHGPAITYPPVLHGTAITFPPVLHGTAITFPPGLNPDGYLYPHEEYERHIKFSKVQYKTKENNTIDCDGCSFYFPQFIHRFYKSEFHDTLFIKLSDPKQREIQQLEHLQRAAMFKVLTEGQPALDKILKNEPMMTYNPKNQIINPAQALQWMTEKGGDFKNGGKRSKRKGGKPRNTRKKTRSARKTKTN